MDVTFIATIAQLGIGFLFVLAGVAKLFSQKDFVATLASYPLLPARAIGPMGILLPSLELVVGFCLLFNIGIQYFLPISVIMLVIFTSVALINVIQKKPDGCGCFGPRLEPKATWLAVTIRNFFLLAASIGLLLLHTISGVEAAPVHAVVGIFTFTVAVLLGLPIQNIGALLQQSKPNVDRRQFLRQAGAVTAGSVGLAVSTSVDRVQAQTKSPGLVVEHETELSSLAEALQQCPREVPIPSSLPNGYELHRVGAFFEKNTQDKVIRDLVLHYQQDADHQLVVMLSK